MLLMHDKAKLTLPLLGIWLSYIVDLVNEGNCTFVLSAFVTGMDNTFTL
jgi:hypothetical protein